ncbi:hypothetical protein FISHEDRAFT_58192 [Fistulina hepatica ATCC 64428]|nr:hypothetical protein FISHEDRAFT_58192 [Fistulina hepatica ATCC 64428]
MPCVDSSAAVDQPRLNMFSVSATIQSSTMNTPPEVKFAPNVTPVRFEAGLTDGEARRLSMPTVQIEGGEEIDYTKDLRFPPHWSAILAQRGVRSRRKNIKRDPDHVNRPCNAWILFRTHALNVHLVPPGLSQKDLNLAIVEIWKSLPDVIRRAWDKTGTEHREAHQKAHPDYKYRPETNASEVERSKLAPQTKKAEAAAKREQTRLERAERKQCKVITEKKSTKSKKGIQSTSKQTRAKKTRAAAIPVSSPSTSPSPEPVEYYTPQLSDSSLPVDPSDTEFYPWGTRYGDGYYFPDGRRRSATAPLPSPYSTPQLIPNEEPSFFGFNNMAAAYNPGPVRFTDPFNNNAPIPRDDELSDPSSIMMPVPCKLPSVSDILVPSCIASSNNDEVDSFGGYSLFVEEPEQSSSSSSGSSPFWSGSEQGGLTSFPVAADGSLDALTNLTSFSDPNLSLLEDAAGFSSPFSQESSLESSPETLLQTHAVENMEMDLYGFPRAMEPLSYENLGM